MVKQARSLRTHELVLDAAAAEFVRHGYPRANLQHVAARTGLTKGALYGHFASKEHLARALTEHSDAVVDEILARPADAALPVPARMRALSCALAERIEADVRVSAALRLALDEGPEAPEPPRLLTGLRELAGEAGAVPDGRSASPADLAAVILVGAYCTAPDLERRGLAERVRELWDTFAEGGAGGQTGWGTASR